MNKRGWAVKGLLLWMVAIVVIFLGWKFVGIIQRTGEVSAFQQEILRTLRVGEKPNVNRQDDQGRTVLTWAAVNGEKDLCAVIIALGADPNARDRSGRTPLSHAAGRGHWDVVDFLLTHKANPNLADNEGMTPLMWAAFHSHAPVVELLLKKGADRTAKDKKGRTAAMIAQDILKRYEQTVTLLAQ